MTRPDEVELLELFGQTATHGDLPYLRALITGSAQQTALLRERTEQEWDAAEPRALMHAILLLLADDIATGTGQHHDATRMLAERLRATQGENGLFSSEGNIDSPPDSAFTVNDLTAAVTLIDSYSLRLPTEGTRLRAELEGIALAAAPALTAGGVHTPNHRWEVASALAGLNAHWPDPRVRARAQAWLTEGIDVDADGLYSERSAIYAAEVTNPSLLGLARELERPELRDIVRRNLHAMSALIEDDGETENVHSRRQDQRLRYDAELFLGPLREFAIADGDGDLARLAHDILDRGLTHPARHLAETLRTPLLARALPEPNPAPAHTERYFGESRLLRMRRGALSVSMFAGSDFGRTRRISSGLANSATLLRARTGNSVLRSLRVAPTFFSMGCLRPDTLELIGGGAILREHRESGYYEPLSGPADLSHPVDEGRFFASMAFDQRTRLPITLDSTVAIRVEDEHTLSIDLAFAGVATGYAVELVLDRVTALEGATALDDDSWWLRGTPGMSTATLHTVSAAGSGTVEVTATGAGTGLPDFDEGEIFTYPSGNDRIEGTRLLLSGSTSEPLQLRLRFTAQNDGVG